MTNRKTHYSCAELAEMRLPGLPTSERRIRDRVMRDKWEFTVEKSAGRTGQTRLYSPPAKLQRLIDPNTKIQVDTEMGEITLQLTVSLAEAERILRWLRKSRNG